MASAAATKAMSATDEEALIRKRLLTQTTTARPGADPPVKKLVKRYLAACQAARDGAGTEEWRNTEAFMKELALYEFQLERVAAVRSADAREMESRTRTPARTWTTRWHARQGRHARAPRLPRIGAPRSSTQGGVRGPASALRALTRRATTEAACARLEKEIAALGESTPPPWLTCRRSNWLRKLPAVVSDRTQRMVRKKERREGVPCHSARSGNAAVDPCSSARPVPAAGAGRPIAHRQFRAASVG